MIEKNELEKAYNIGVDLGGTHIKIGIVDAVGNVLFSNTINTPKDAASIALKIAEAIIELVDQNAISYAQISGIGVGCPGIIDRKDGIVSFLTNLNIQNFDIAGAIRIHLIRKKLVKDLYVSLINDADAAALAEHRLGAGKGYANMLMITLGTGLGGGIIINNELYEGTSAAGEFGHMIISAGGRRCGCGYNGCLEAYASVTALLTSAKLQRTRYKDSLLNRYKVLDAEAVFDSYFRGDMAAIKAVKEFIYYLSAGIVSLSNIFRPQAIIIGGGVSALGDKLINIINDEIKRHDSFTQRAIVPLIKHAKFFNDAGVIGAALYGGMHGQNRD